MLENEGFCPKCGKPYVYIGDPINTAGQANYCTCGIDKSEEETPIGWICPKCGRGVAPWESVCNHGAIFTIQLPYSYDDTTSLTYPNIPHTGGS